MKPKARNGLIAALDVGTTKVCCFVARAKSPGEPEIIGLSHQLSRGMRRGIIVDMELAEEAVRSAVHAAEQMADETISQVIVSQSGGQPYSLHKNFDIAVSSSGGGRIEDIDLQHLFAAAWTHPETPDDFELMHIIPNGFTVGGENGVRDPRGMASPRLGSRLHLLSNHTSAVRNLQTVVERCHLEIERQVVKAYASGLGCLVADEMDLGVTLIDMGGGTTDIAIFVEGELVHVHSLPVGGTQVTNDIARGLTTPVAHAEKMKTKFGSTLPAPSDDHEIIRVPLVGDEDDAEGTTIARSVLVGIIQPRIEETFEMVRDHIKSSGFEQIAGNQVVLTGGASLLGGVPETASRILNKKIRQARPHKLPGLAESTSGPEFSTCVGLIRYAIEKQGLWPEPSLHRRQVPEGLFGKLGNWFRENF